MKYSKQLKELSLLNSYSIYNKIKSNKQLKNDLIKSTSFLKCDTKNPIRIWYIKKDIYEQVLCPMCSNFAKIDHKNDIIKCCSFSCTVSLVNPKTGLTIAQEIGNKTKKTNSKVDPETGLTGYQKAGLKSKQSNSQIDPETGLTGYQKTGINSKIGNSKIDPETGLTGYQTGALKSKEILSKVDPKTGLTGYQKIGINSKIGNSKVDPETGLTGYQVSRKKQGEGWNAIDPETGLTGHQINKLKSFETMSQVDPETGLSYNELKEFRRQESLSQIDPETRLTGYQNVGRKAKESKLKIDPETGLTGYQQSGINSKKVLSQIDLDTGLTGYQNIGLKSAKSNLIKKYNKRLKDFPNDYTLLTSENEYLNSRLLKYSCNKCGSIRESYWPYIRCTKCYPYNKSIGENEVLKYCQSLTSDVISGDRKLIKPLELDIYIPDYNLAIEYDGLFWHSSDSIDSENQDYHLNKTRECEKQGIQLFRIFENEWVDPTKQNIWKSIIRNRLDKSERIYARKTEVRSVSSKNKTEFLNSNHLQGNCNSSVNLGLYYENELVSIMTFGKSRFDKKVDWELLRFCNKVGYSVVGGAGKLLKRFTSEYSGNIISYADKRRSNGNLYKQLGFELSHESGPNYWYFKDQGLESRLQYQKHKLRDKLDIFDDDKTESENMYENGYRKIYDCGNQVWILNNNQ